MNFHSVWFTIIFERWQSEIWNEILFWYFKLLLFYSIARNVLNVKAKVSVFFTILLVDWPHHQYYITNINYDSRGSKSNWWVSEKRSAVTLGRAGYMDDELIVYNSMTYRIPKVEPARGGEHNSGATPRQYVWREIGWLVKSPELHDHAPSQMLSCSSLYSLP